MGYWSLLEVASMPIMEVLILSGIGGLIAADFFNLLSTDTSKALNKIVFVVFTPSLIFASLVKTVTFQAILSWWFMPINIGITFVCGGILGWAAVKLIKPEPYLEGLIIAMCSTGNFANLLLIMVPAICMDDGSPFGDHSVCKTKGLSYASFSMALGSFYTWTCTYQLIQGSALRYNAMKEAKELSKKPNKDLDTNDNTHLLNDKDQEDITRNMPSLNSISEDTENQPIMHQGSAGNEEKKDGSFSNKLVEILKKILEQLLAPPTLGSRWNHTLPHSYTRRQPHTRSAKANVRPMIIVMIICMRYLILPMIGIVVIKTAGRLGLLPLDPLFNFVLLIMFALPPGLNISTMTQLFDVGQAECSVLMMWTYLAAAFALTTWSMVFMWILS